MTKRILLAVLAASAFLGCSNQDGNGSSSSSGGSSSTVGGQSDTGGSSAQAGSSARSSGSSSSAGGNSATGGSSSPLYTATGGTSGAGGAASTGGKTTAGGSTGTGGVATGGTSQGGGSHGGAAGSSTVRPNDDGGAGSTGTPDAGSARDAHQGDTASGGSAGYQPCPSDGTACKILPMGDSITNGVGSSDKGGYRVPLFKLMASASQKTTFTGSQKSGPTNLQVSGQTFVTRHEGHNGWGISQVNPNSGNSKGLTTLIPSPAFDASNGGPPHIVLLHIGTNDSGTYSATQMASDLKDLLQQITSAAPEALVVVAQIVPLGYGDNAVIKAYNQAIPGIVDAQIAAKKHVTRVDMFTGFTTSSMIASDKVHPNDSGYAFMAERWHSVIGPYLPK